MQTILLGRPIGGPRRTPSATRGARDASAPAQTATAEKPLVVILAEPRCVDSRAVVELQARPFLSRWSESNHLHATRTPPSIGYASPVTNDASSEHRYSARKATSSEVPMRPMG